MIKPRHLDGIAALIAADNTSMRKIKGERDTEFVKRIVAAYMNALSEARKLRETIATSISISEHQEEE